MVDGRDEDKVMEDCFEAGASDFNIQDDVIEISTEPAGLSSVREVLQNLSYNILSAEVEQIPSTYTALTDEDAIKKMNLLLEHLEDNDDVQNVYHNWEMPEDDEG